MSEEVTTEKEVVPFTGRTVPKLTKPIQRALKKKLAEVDSNTIVTALHAVYHLIGGVQRFAEWADKNPNDFFRIYAKTLEHKPAPAAENNIQVVLAGGTALPQSPLDAIKLRDEKEVNANYLADAE